MELCELRKTARQRSFLLLAAWDVNVTFPMWLVPVRSVPERGGEWGFRGSPFAGLSRHTLPRLRDGTAPQIPAVSLNILFFFSASRIVFFVARDVFPRDEKYYSRREKTYLIVRMERCQAG